ncbi:Ger(x)C family spore germination protein [Paenibacillus silviterrae]|uniref:Ger(x)C family spore germination protein n=1 Tax=Paenibacillus silviterrae TaxID=3242194 RepID=UPI002542A63A|nr:Ger(x)C family spore germination protein [Paenibacillus chinjuensis]
MKRFRRVAAVYIFLSLLLTGCWDIKNIEDINYFTGIGFDYVDNEYRVYGQMIDFSSVAKVESGKPTQPVPVWVGVGKGETLVGAYNDLYRSSQMRIFYGHVNAVIVSDSVLKTGLKPVKELLSRYYEIRYTPWIFGTNQPIGKLFSVSPMFNLSSILSLLHQPQETYRQQSLISPVTVREFISEYREPGNATLLPSLTTTAQNWKSDDKTKDMLVIDGIYIFQDQAFCGWLDWKRVMGLRWMNPETHRSPLLIHTDGKPQVAVSLESPKPHISPRITMGQVTFDINLRLSGYISEEFEKLPESELERKIAEKVESEIKNTFMEGLRVKSDILRLEHTLYRDNIREWKNLKSQGGIRLHSGSIGHIKAEINLNHSGKLKY